MNAAIQRLLIQQSTEALAKNPMQVAASIEKAVFYCPHGQSTEDAITEAIASVRRNNPTWFYPQPEPDDDDGADCPKGYYVRDRRGHRR